MNWKGLDWKFYASMIATVASIVIPVYVWQSDLSAHSLELKLRSTTALQPASDIQELQIFLNGEKLESPYLSSFELVNTGSKSILSSDFETPIQLTATTGLKVVSAQITSTNPRSIPVKITFDEQRAVIAPFLSNPKDTVTFSIITSGDWPRFEHQARIAGVKEVTFQDSSNGALPYFPVLLILSGLLLVSVNLIYTPAAIMGMDILVTRRLATFTGVSSMIGSSTAMSAGITQLDSLSEAWRIGIGAIVLAVGTAIAVKTFHNMR
ncbi:hypothetical protein [Pseudomonas fluorescens]|uniref:hypothetical protein n=1 Tax=Pseudomonas fluorescens TaxID=294 RepID=UPI0007324453|nr:hypothetical protein [Pseudomonas fluorescens]